MSTINSDLASTILPTSALLPHQVPADHRAVLDFTRQLFGQEPSVELEIDPETSERSFLVIAPAVGVVAELVALDDRWHRELKGAVGSAADLYRLMIDPQ